MAQQPNVPRVPAQNDLYTALLIMAAALLFAGLIFLLVRSVQLFDWPWAA
jgi:hypothetical protein